MTEPLAHGGFPGVRQRVLDDALRELDKEERELIELVAAAPLPFMRARVAMLTARRDALREFMASVPGGTGREA